MRGRIRIGLDRMQEAADAGVAFAEISVGELRRDAEDEAFARIASRSRAAPLPVEVANCFLPGAVRGTGPDVNLNAVRAHMERVMPRAAQAGPGGV